MPDLKHDQDASKGATEETDHAAPGNAGMEGQLGHRDQDPRIKGSDSDFPEPGGSPEHSGEPGGSPAQKRPPSAFWRFPFRSPH